MKFGSVVKMITIMAKLDELVNKVSIRSEFATRPEKERIWLMCLKTISELEVSDGLKTVFQNVRKVKGLSGMTQIANAENEPKHKKIRIQNSKGFIQRNFIITLNIENCNAEAGYDIVDLLESLLEEVKLFKVKDPPSFRLKFDEDNEIKSFKDFFSAAGNTFIVSLA
jgi:hypothetical protein